METSLSDLLNSLQYIFSIVPRSAHSIHFFFVYLRQGHKPEQNLMLQGVQNHRYAPIITIKADSSFRH